MDDLLAKLTQAVALRVSDVYLLPKDDAYQLVFRLPTALRQQAVVEAATARRWLNFLKYQAGMNVAEQRRVQLGALTLSEPAISLRLSSVADYRGQETLVLRLIYALPPLDEWSQEVVASLVAAIASGGMLALSGATGAGKTTLLYQVASALSETKMVMTIEDPVEIAHPAFLQLQVNLAANMTYAALLKAALRHRPDVLIIGEIRDLETAQIACEAAISGHVVLTTVHARSAEVVPLRLRSLGVASALVEAALTVSGQVTLVSEPVVHPAVTLAYFQKEAAR